MYVNQNIYDGFCQHATVYQQFYILFQWLEAQKVIPSLIGLLKPDVDSDRHSNVAQLLSDVIRKSRENLRENPLELDPILSALEK